MMNTLPDQSHTSRKRAARDPATRLLTRPDLAEARWHFERCCEAARAWDTTYTKALKDQGAHGVMISGIGRTHFAQHTQRALRDLCSMIGKHRDAAHEARPRGVRVNTIHALGRAVATRDGGGFYGPQAHTERT